MSSSSTIVGQCAMVPVAEHQPVVYRLAMEDRQFVDPNEGCTDTSLPDTPSELNSQDTVPMQAALGEQGSFLDFLTCAQSQVVLPLSPLMLQTIREVAEELLISSMAPQPPNHNSEAESQARNRLAKLGLKEYQITRLIEYELNLLRQRNPRAQEQARMKEQGNLVHTMMRKKQRDRQLPHNRRR